MKATTASRRRVKTTTTTTVRALDYRYYRSPWLLLLMLGFLVVNTSAMQDFQLTMAPSTSVPAASSAPVTKAPVTKAPITKAPVTKAPITKAPVTKAPVTKAPVTRAPVSPAPVTSAPVTSAPTNRVTLAPVTKAPVTAVPSASPSAVESESPSTESPTFAPSKATRPPVTFVPLTLAPVTAAPTTLAPITAAPVTRAPVTKAPVTTAPVAPPALEVNATFISVTIVPVEGGMNDEEQEIFRATAEEFLSKTLSRIETPIGNVKVQVTDQMVQDVEFRATRALQEASLLVTMFVEGTVTENPEEVNLAWLSLLMFDINGKTFVDDLKATDDDYFKDVKEVMPVNPPDDSAPPSNAPSSSVPPSTVGPTASAVPTTAPSVSLEPSMNNVLTATDQFAVTIFSVTSRMSEETAETFRTTAELFLGTNYALLEQPFTNIQLQVVGQELQSSSGRRYLQQTLPLEVKMTIQGDFTPVEGMVTSPEDANLSQKSRNFFDAQADTFVDLLQESDRVEDAVFFANVNDVESVDEVGDIVVPSPTPAPQSNGGGGGGLAIGAIIAIALCGTLAVSLTAAAVYQHRRKNRAAATARSNADRSALRDTTSNNNKKKKQQPSQQQPSSAGSNLNYGDGDSILQSDMQSQMGADTLAGADTMSYAYSLDHGIDPSVASGPQGSDYYAGSNVPMEIPMVGSLGSNIDYDYDDLQSNKTKSNKITRECFAPPGRLGVVIDTTVEGPVVHKVNPGSPLEGIVWPGDIIIAIDDVDTRSLAANDITALMVKNQDQRRKLTIVSDA